MEHAAEASDLLAAAWRSGDRLTALPASLRPATVDEAHAIQFAIAGRLGEPIGGWKVSVDRPIRGPILASRLLRSPARISASRMLRRVVEGEVAFIFHVDIPPSVSDYSRDEVASCVSACAAIEVVDSRFQNYTQMPELDRVADLYGNSALVYGEPVASWRELDFATIKIRSSIDERIVVERRGGHASGDPLHACVLLVNSLRGSIGVKAGQIVTTGTYTGTPVMEIGSTFVVQFDGLGSASLTFTL